MGKTRSMARGEGLSKLLEFCGLGIVASMTVGFCAPLSAGSTLFSQQNVIADNTTSPAGIRSVAAADVDGDGDVDIFTSSTGDSRVIWYENLSGDPVAFSARPLSATVAGTSCVTIGDLDGDGDLDVIAAAGGLNSVVWFENRHPEVGFTATRIVSSSAENVEWVHAVDLDRDGELDVVSCLTGEGTVLWHRNQGDGTFEDIDLADSILGVKSVHSSDFDDDGDTDLVCAGTFGQLLLWLENEGAPAFEPHPIDAQISLPVSVIAADLDNDDVEDVVAAAMGENSVVWYRNNGGGSFGSKQTIGFGVLGSSSVDCADIDGDGDLDVLSASQLDDKVSWFENHLDGSFTRHVVSDRSTRATTVAVGDFNADGRLDILSGSSGNNKVAWHENTANGDFPERIVAQTLVDGPWFVDAGDLTGNGYPDLVVGSRADEKLVVFANSGPESLEFEPTAITEDFYNALSVHIADVDGDGRNDVLAASPQGNRLSLFHNLGDLNFTENVLSTTAESQSAVSGDLDGDGDLDLVSISNGGSAISWYENIQSENIPERPIDDDVRRPVSVGVGDLDGDGDLDVFGAAETQGSVQWYENDGASPPGFTVHTVVSDLGRVVQAIAADIDGDGSLDLLSASHRDEEIHWYRNDGQSPPGFTQHLVSDEAGGVLRIYAGDLNRDGHMDVLAANSGSSQVAYLENNGDSTFTFHTVTGNDDYPNAVLAVDLDGDKDLDVVSTSLLEDRVSWYENLFGMTSTPTQTPSPTETPAVTPSLQDYDLHPDGRIDQKDLIALLESWRLERSGD